jgi:hypothetical protein
MAQLAKHTSSPGQAHTVLGERGSVMVSTLHLFELGIELEWNSL